MKQKTLFSITSLSYKDQMPVIIQNVAFIRLFLIPENTEMMKNRMKNKNGVYILN